MLRYFSRSELGKNCTPIFSPLCLTFLQVIQGKPLSTLLYGFSVCCYLHNELTAFRCNRTYDTICVNLTKWGSTKSSLASPFLSPWQPLPLWCEFLWHILTIITSVCPSTSCMTLCLLLLSFNVLLGLIHKFYLVS